MAYPQIRINKTEQFQSILETLKKYYPLLGEADIVKLALSKLYVDCTDGAEISDIDPTPDELLYNAAVSFDLRSDNDEPTNIAYS